MKFNAAIEANSTAKTIDLPMANLLGVSSLPEQLATVKAAKERAKMPDHHFPVRETLALLWALQRGRPVMLVGPKGCGKTSLATSLAELVGLPAHRFQCHADVEPLDLFGSKGIDNGSTVWEDGPSSYARRRDQMIVFDEADSLSPAAQMALMGYLENLPGQDFSLPGNWSDEPLSLPTSGNQPIILTSNTGGRPELSSGYVGTGEVNSALLDRCVVIEMTYMPREQEISLLASKTGESSDFARYFVSAASRTREMHMNGEMDEPVSTRSLIEWMHGTPVLGFELSTKINVLDKVKDSRDREKTEQSVQSACGELHEYELKVS